TWADDVKWIKGSHSWSAGVWIQRIQANPAGSSSSSAGSFSYPTLLAFLQDSPTQFTIIPSPTPLGYRSTEFAWYVQDEFKLKPNLTLRLGLRDEMTNGWNEVTGRCANIAFDSNGVIKSDTVIGPNCLSQNNAKS